MDKKESREAERIWRIVKAEYEKYISYRDKIIKSGFRAIILSSLT